ncbi:hypothetical protein F2Q69_00055844 [Brassica cretica]|uniref:Uncharacterized protein n=1 Tax=Brassica cretica TaxID=69181 RepID=A0A8S9N892_BRACR|nr:hypothetical protein F2Q69_00055844 [Brassica cretica]
MDDFRVFNQMVLIFHLNISGSDFGRLLENLLGNLLKYNALEESSRRLQRSLPDDFHDVFQTTSKKSFRRFQRSLLTESSSISSVV